MIKPFLLSVLLPVAAPFLPFSSPVVSSAASPAVSRSAAFPAVQPSTALPAVPSFTAVPSEPAGLTVMFWNLENFFDYFDDGTGESDTEFSFRGARRWTKKRFLAKCNSIAKSILWLSSPSFSTGIDSSTILSSASTSALDSSPILSSASTSALDSSTILSSVSTTVPDSSIVPSSVSTTVPDAGGLPDIIAFAEVENRFVLRRLISETALRKLDYEIVHYDSPDPRGIDCALLYRHSRLQLLTSKPCPVGLSPDTASTLPPTPLSSPSSLSPLPLSPFSDSLATRDTLRTRDILLAQFLTPSGDSLAVLVNHHPSKYGGGETDWRREIAIGRLRDLSDSLAAEGWHDQIALGDFNDTPDNPLFSRLSPALVLCRYGNIPLSADSLSFRSHPSSRSSVASSSRSPFSASRQYSSIGRSSSFTGTFAPRQSSSIGRSSSVSGRQVPRGSIRFNGDWQLIDLCFASPAIAPCCSFRAVFIPFLTERDAAHSGDKPLRTYSGPRYLGGVSDHLPILVTIIPSSP